MNTLLAQVVADPGSGIAGKNSLGVMLKLNETQSVGGRFFAVSHFINLLLPLSFIIAGLIFLFLLIGGGFAIIASGGNAKNVEQGKNQILTAVIGFVVIFAAYWIIQIVEIVTGVSILNGSQNF